MPRRTDGRMAKGTGKPRPRDGVPCRVGGAFLVSPSSVCWTELGPGRADFACLSLALRLLARGSPVIKTPMDSYNFAGRPLFEDKAFQIVNKNTLEHKKNKQSSPWVPPPHIAGVL
jgi:hypothetical protein